MQSEYTIKHLIKTVIFSTKPNLLTRLPYKLKPSTKKILNHIIKLIKKNTHQYFLPLHLTQSLNP